MKIQHLIDKLSKMDKTMDVICYDEEGGIFLNIEDIIEIESEKTRNEKGIAGLKFTKSDLSEKHLLITVSTSF